jgi:TonB-dependent receptor
VNTKTTKGKKNMAFRYKLGYLRLKLQLQPLFLLLIIAGLLNSSNLFAQTGTLQGTITDAGTGDPLPGANIYMDGTAIGAASDIKGEYTIKSMPAGKANIIVSYIGYEKKVIEVNIAANKSTRLDVNLDWSAASMEDIVVTGQLEGQAQAINQQISSDQIVNVVSEQKIKELPDANAAESVGRLPGVAVQRDGGEASKLMIRGLDPKFTNVAINGIQVPGTSADARDVDLSIISQSTLSGIELYKALTPDQDADAIAGVVNLVTGQAKADQKILVDLYGIYSGMNNTARQYRLSAQYSNRFWDGFLGLQAGINAEQRDRSREMYTDNWTLISKSDGSYDYEIGELLVEYDKEIRKRYGGNINLDINTPDGGNIKFINLYSKTDRDIFISNRNYTTSGNVTYLTEAIDRETYTFNNSLIGQNHLGDLKVDWALSHAYTKNEKPFDHFMRFYESKSVNTGMMNITDPSVLKLAGKHLVGYAWNNFSKATVDRAYFYQDNNNERNYDLKADFEYPIRFMDNLAGIVKAGYKFRSKTRHRNTAEKMTAYWLRSSFDYYYDDDGNIAQKDWGGSLWPDGYHGLMTDFLAGEPYPTRMLNDEYLLNPVLDENLIRQWYEFSKNGTNATGQQHEYFDHLTSVRDKYNVKENVHGTYAMVKLNAGQIITLIGGVRYEAEHNEYNANFAPRIVGEFEYQTGTVSDTTAKFTKEYWLPNAHLRIKPLEWLDLRLAVSKSISRPDYSMRLPMLYVNNQDHEIKSGNPYLEPAVSWNYDANISLYASQYGLLTISGFRKNIDNVFYWLNDIVIMNSEQAAQLGLPVEQYGPFNQYSLDMPLNTKGTKVWGLEIELQTHLSFLPGALQYIVVSANYSRVWSKTKYPRFQLVKSSGFPPVSTPSYYNTERELSGQTDYTGNASVGYDYKGFSGRVSVYFQGPYLAAISNIEVYDIYQKAFSRWDLALKQAIMNNLTVYANINNFTNVVEGKYLVYRKLDMGGYLYGVSAELGVQVSL